MRLKCQTLNYNSEGYLRLQSTSRYTLRPRSINNANAARVVYLPLGHLGVKLSVYTKLGTVSDFDRYCPKMFKVFLSLISVELISFYPTII